jgi:hypothetical protein
MLTINLKNMHKDFFVRKVLFITFASVITIIYIYHAQIPQTPIERY